MGFKFRLEKILKHRKSLEEIARKNFLEANIELREAKALLNSLYVQVDEAQAERHQLVLAGGTPAENLCQIYEYIKGTEIKIDRQKLVVREKKEKVEKMQLALQEASIEYKMIEKLETRQREEYRLIQKKLEEKELTEMANTRFNLRQKNGE